ncbi:MAG: DnaB helicase C-terminal domain-containing protein [Syntrophales bacterium]|nr:DnaB helicase C-terminal domain-containing protein [Syntrophales bacterium]
MPLNDVMGAVYGDVIVYFRERIKRMTGDKKSFLQDLAFFDELTRWVRMGGVVARPGVGKTALMVQMAIRSMFKKEQVLHVSLHEPVSKVSVWYDELFSRLASELEPAEKQVVWERMLPFRMIMSFRIEGFRVPVFQERLEDLIVQNVFRPRVVLFDGMPPDQIRREIISSIKAIAERHSFQAWLSLSVTENRIETSDNLSALENTNDLFEAFLFLSPVDDVIKITLCRNKEWEAETLPFILNPTSFLVVERK